MNDADSTNLRLAELLRQPDDLDKLQALKSDFTRKKAAVDAQLKIGLKEQLQLTQAGMTSLKDGQTIANQIRDEMAKIDRLCAEAQTMIRSFPEINAVAQAHRNFTQVKAMKSNIESFDAKLKDVNALIEEDEQDLQTQANLIQIHYGITQLRNIRDEAMDQIKKTNDHSLAATLEDHFKGLDDAVEDFDDHVGVACQNLIPLVQEGNDSLVVRLAVIIEEEEKFDNRIKELQDAQREFKDLASRFQSLATGPNELRGYKDKFLDTIKISAQSQINKANEAFMEDPDKLEKSVRWYFNDLNTVKIGMAKLMPKKWKIFRTYVQIYHQLMYDWLASRAEDKDCNPTHMLAIIHWKDKYYNKMARLGVATMDISDPTLPGGNDSALVKEYRQLIVDKVEEWMNQINKTDRQAFVSRDESAHEDDEHGYRRTKTLSDMWRMLREQLVVSSTSDLQDVTEGVVDAMYRALKTRTDMWSGLINDELERYSRPGLDYDGIEGLQDWLVALANDQIASIVDESDAGGQPGYLASWQADYNSVVSRDYADEAGAQKFETMRESMTDLGVRCIAVFSKLMFAVDFRTIMTEFFTPVWYTKKGMGQIVTTFEDYFGDYAERLHPTLMEVLVEDLAKQLLTAYLGCVRNKGAKFRRFTDDYTGKMREDIQTVFAFFGRYDFFEANGLKANWVAVNDMLGLIDVDKHALGAQFAGFLQTYWDVKLSWVEAVLRTRDDIDWGPLGDGKTIMKGLRAQAAELRVEGEPTALADVG